MVLEYHICGHLVGFQLDDEILEHIAQLRVVHDPLHDLVVVAIVVAHGAIWVLVMPRRTPKNMFRKKKEEKN